ncbi:hypothetical protein HOE04_00635 [archaeon]|jgi:hypothetical protein|nr:hypothetical protein [archaeon]
MDSPTTFIYAVGSADEIRQGDFDCLGISHSYEGLKKYLRVKSGIVLPQFVGVYQHLGLELNEEGEVDPSDHKGLFFKKTDEVVSGLAKEVLKLSLGINNNAHPNLMHVIYDSENWNEELVRMSLQDEQKRIAISSQDGTPDFYNKDMGLIYDTLEMLVKEETDGELIKQNLSKISDEMNLYGLILNEYAVWKLATSNRSNIMANPSLLTSLGDLFKKQ